MEKRIAITFVFGVFSGIGISAIYFSGQETVITQPGEVKVLTRTEYKTIREDSSAETPSMDIPKYPDEPVEDNIGADAAEGSIEERSMAGDDESENSPEDSSAVSPEEAPPEIIPEENEESSED